jgi:XisH protein
MAKDKYHEQVKAALINDGWTITHDPLTIAIGRRKGFIDLGAEKTIIAAERDEEKIAVEVRASAINNIPIKAKLFYAKTRQKTQTMQRIGEYF